MNSEIFLLILRILLILSLYAFLIIGLFSMWQGLGKKDQPDKENNFLDALSLLDQERNTHHTLSDSFIIGRHPSANLVLDDEAVSNRHARIHWEKGQWWLSDLSSRNGSYLNGVRIEEASVLTENDEITIGHTQFSLSSRR